jgi:hypothetical protein
MNIYGHALRSADQAAAEKFEMLFSDKRKAKTYDASELPSGVFAHNHLNCSSFASFIANFNINLTSIAL